MKKCPTCDKTYEDSMRFCQLDGATLVDDEPAFDPYATIVSTPSKPIILEPEAVEEVAAPVEEAAEEPIIHQTVGSIAIAPPDDILDLPEVDPLKTMYASDTEMSEILAEQSPVADEAAVEEPVVEQPAFEEPVAVEKVAEPEPPSFIAPEVAAPSFGDMSPPPSPFSTPEVAGEGAVPQPVFDEPAPAEPMFDEAATMIQPAVSVDIPFDPPQPVAEWTPPPAPDPSWQNQEIGANTPFQPPPAGVGGENKTLAIISLVTGILSLFCCGWFIPGIVAIVLGFIAKGKATSDPANYGGAGLALGGIITGAISLVLGVIVVILYFLGFAASLMK